MLIIGLNAFASSGKDTYANVLEKQYDFCKIAMADPMKRIAMQVWDLSYEQLWGDSKFRSEPDKRYPRQHDIVQVKNKYINEFGRAGTIYKYECACCGIEHKAGIQVEQLPQCYLTPRYILQQMGSEFGQKMYKTTWVDLCFNIIQKLSSSQEEYDQTKDPRYFQAKKRAEPYSGFIISDIRYDHEAQAVCEPGNVIWQIVRPGAGLKGAAGQHSSEKGIDPKYIFHTIDNSCPLEKIERNIEEALEKTKKHLGI